MRLPRLSLFTAWVDDQFDQKEECLSREIGDTEVFSSAFELGHF